MRCDECKHWKREEGDPWRYVDKWAPFGRCLAIPERWRIMDEATSDQEFGWADAQGWDEWGDEPPPKNSWEGVRIAALKSVPAVVQDGSDYHAELLTQAHFFCALFAQGIEAPSGGETTEIGSTEGESPVAESDAPG